MYLYLIRHGEALSPEDDPLRPLSMMGRQEITKIAHYLKAQNIALDAIYHSHKARAMQTAQIIASELEFEQELQLEYCLDPDNNVSALCNWVDSLSGNCLLAGHLPNLALLSHYLLAESLQKISFDFPTGALACFRKETTVWVLEWFIKPDLI